jgi:ferredoxin-type protein NapH
MTPVPRGGWLARRADLLRLFFLVALNGDLAVWRGMLRTGRAAVSQSPLKGLCAPGLNCYSCPSAVTSCPVGALQFWLNGSAERSALGERVTLTGLYVMGFIVALGALGGRIWCGLVCPFGAVQEWISRAIGGGRNLKLPRFTAYAKYAVALIFVIGMPLLLVDGLSLGPAFCKYICPSGTLFAGIPLLAVDPRLRDAASWISLLKGGVLVAVIGMLIVSRRFFCKTLCPLGATWGLFNRISIIRMEVERDRCTDCGSCAQVCPMHVDLLHDINSPECVRCLECIKACPEAAISLRARRARGQAGGEGTEGAQP